MTPGIYEIAAERYHADPAPAPSLSASIANLMLSRSPRHAWEAHPQLNPDYEPDNRRDFDLGSAAHAALLEGSSQIEVIEASDYRTVAAREARDAALAQGKLPLLPHQWNDVQAMVSVAIRRLARAHDETASFRNHGAPERMLIWQEGETWCRSLVDWLPDDPREPIWDYKTTGGSAHPDAWGRQIWSLGYDVQAAFYLRGRRAIMGDRASREFRFVVQEADPPYALSIVALTPGAVDLAERKVQRAIDLWTRCLAEDRWPGYPAQTCYVDAPAWHETRWAEAVERDRVPGADALHWQAP